MPTTERAPQVGEYWLDPDLPPYDAARLVKVVADDPVRGTITAETRTGDRHTVAVWVFQAQRVRQER